MKRKVLLLLAFICFALPLQTSAFTFQELPVASKSKQWYIEIDKSKSENLKALQPKNGEFDTYSLFVKISGKTYPMYPLKYIEMILRQERLTNFLAFLI